MMRMPGCHGQARPHIQPLTASPGLSVLQTDPRAAPSPPHQHDTSIEHRKTNLTQAADTTIPGYVNCRPRTDVPSGNRSGAGIIIFTRPTVSNVRPFAARVARRVLGNHVFPHNHGIT